MPLPYGMRDLSRTWPHTLAEWWWFTVVHRPSKTLTAIRERRRAYCARAASLFAAAAGVSSVIRVSMRR
jgi:hypothetical protein